MLRIRMHSRLTIGLLVATMLLSPAILRAADVLDGGSFFNADVLAQANQKIRAIEQKSGHEIRIETFATVPADKVEAVAKMDKSQRETFFKQWQHDRAEATKSRGVFVLICKNPSHLRLWAGTAIQHAGFGAAQAQTVREKLLSGFKAKEYDKTLTDVVEQLATTFDGLSSNKHKAAAPGHKPVANTTPKPAPAPHAPQANGGNFLFIVVLIIGGILLFSFMARLFGGGQSNVPGGMGGYGGGGGGFWSGLTGGLFGAMAGNWLYNQFSDHHASANDRHSPMGDSSNNGGWSDSGSSDSGGSDFGGGDFGGGDGGDFGGGGDF